jgi:hypothetical protein
VREELLGGAAGLYSSFRACLAFRAASAIEAVLLAFPWFCPVFLLSRLLSCVQRNLIKNLAKENGTRSYGMKYRKRRQDL